MSEDGLIDVSRVLIGWSYAEDGRSVGTVLVLEQPMHGRDLTNGLGPREWQKCQFTDGACHRTWMQGHPARTPEGVFSDLLVIVGFRSKGVAATALREFAKIRECEWARVMLAAAGRAV